LPGGAGKTRDRDNLSTNWLVQEDTMSELADLFPGFLDAMIPGDGVDLHCRIGGAGPPLVLLHGYPQTHVMWHRIIADLAGSFTCVVPDLRGYGESGIVTGGNGHAAYAKRAMANDIVALMRGLGHERFHLVGHDRGARVSYRLALDHPGVVTRLAVLDILPTYDYWARMDRAFALKVYHWTFLAQPEPLPETLISRAPVEYLDHTIASWTKARDLSAFDARAMARYRHAFSDPRRIWVTCEDYRAGATDDLAADTADVEAGNRIDCPLLALWGAAGIAPGADTPLDVWRRWAKDVCGREIDSGHFVAEENPAETIAALMPFLTETF